MTLKLQQKKAQQLLSRGFTPSDAAEVLGVSVRSIQRWIAQGKVKGLTEPIVTNEPEVTVESESVQQKVVEMYKSGLEPSIIGMTLGLPTITVNRWITASEAVCLPEQTERAILDLPTEQQALFVSEFPKTLLIEEIERALAEHEKCHRQARLKLNELLHKELDSSEPSIRNVKFLSQEVDRHLKGERYALNVDRCDWFSQHRAIMMLKGYGFAVTDIFAGEQYKQQRKDFKNQ